MSEVEAESEQKVALLQSEHVQFTMSEGEAESEQKMALLQSEHFQQAIRDLLEICEA
jgi:RNA-binding protein YlmH